MFSFTVCVWCLWLYRATNGIYRTVLAEPLKKAPLKPFMPKMMSSVKVQKITEPAHLGEGPHWDSKEEVLYYVDIPNKSLLRYNPKTRSTTSSVLDEQAHFIIPVAGKLRHFAVGMGRRVVEVRWDGQQGTAQVVRTVCEVDQDQSNTTLNDAKVDPRGRIFTGTMAGVMTFPHGEIDRNKGSIYRIDNDGSAHRLDVGIDLSNGLCFDLNEKAFYYVDSTEFAIRRYDYDVETGDISNPRIIFSFKENDIPGFPDGMTIDTDGNLWIANFDGYQVLNVDPRTGKLIRAIAIPTKQVTSVTFGGPNLTDLYVTTACMKLSEEYEKPKPPAGATFKVTGLGVKGHPNLSVKWD